MAELTGLVGDGSLPVGSTAMSGCKHSIYWWDTEPVVPGPPLASPLDCDVCVVGAGYTGLWTAYFLKQEDPSLDVQGALKEGRSAILNPHKLARGLARVVSGLGVTIHERTPALEILPGSRPSVVTPAGRVNAQTVVVATNAYQHRFRQFRNKV